MSLKASDLPAECKQPFRCNWSQLLPGSGGAHKGERKINFLLSAVSQSRVRGCQHGREAKPRGSGFERTCRFLPDSGTWLFVRSGHAYVLRRGRCETAVIPPGCW